MPGACHAGDDVGATPALTVLTVVSVAALAVAVGTWSFWPTLSESLLRLLACLMAATLTFCSRAIFHSESPDLTV